MKYRYVSSFMTFSTLALLSGCLSGTGSNNSKTSSTSANIMSGVAATGAPISNGKVEVKGSNGIVVTNTTAADGSYSANIAALAEPYLVRVIAPNGEKYISVASQSAVAEGKKVNITPLTHTIVANVFSNANADDLFSNFETKAANFSEQKLEDEKHELLQKFVDAGLIGAGKVAEANIDLLNGNLQAGTSIGVDGLLDVIKVNTDGANGIEIALKGSNTALIVDKVDATDPAIVPISNSDLLAANAQLDVISTIRARMNALASLHASKTICNGAPVDTMDNSNPCDLDNLYSAFLPFFHPEYQDEGDSRDAAIWGWICRTDGGEAISKSNCMMSGQVKFENVSLKDITLIEYNDSTKVALLSFNLYKDGKLKGAEELFMKTDSSDHLYKLLGSRKTFKYWIDTESLQETNYDLGVSTIGYQGSDSYSVNLNMNYRSSGSYGFSGGETFTLTSAKQIFPNNLNTMTIYLVKGPTYQDSNSCSTGLVFSTTPNPYRIFNPNTGVETYTDFQTACAYTNDACNCRVDQNQLAWFDHEKAQKVKLTGAQVALMDKIEKITLSGSGVSGDAFTIKKPLLVNEFNAKSWMPLFGESASDFCKRTTPVSSLSLSVASGTLNNVGLHYGLSDVNNMSWINVNDSRNFSENVKLALFQPQFQSFSGSAVVKFADIYLSSRDDYDRQFIRRVSCHNN